MLFQENGVESDYGLTEVGGEQAEKAWCVSCTAIFFLIQQLFVQGGNCDLCI